MIKKNFGWHKGGFRKPKYANQNPPINTENVKRYINTLCKKPIQIIFLTKFLTELPKKHVLFVFVYTKTKNPLFLRYIYGN